jgi:hypothetical protein
LLQKTDGGTQRLATMRCGTTKSEFLELAEEK